VIGYGPEKPESLHVTATLANGVAFNAPPMLDALLAWVIAARKRIIPGADPSQLEPIDVPLAREPGGRFHLCSQGFGRIDGRETNYKNRRAPWQEYARLGSKRISRVNVSVAEDKSYRVPYSTLLIERMEWWCIGDPDQIADLLSDVHYLGRHRGSGHGRINLPWLVERYESWGDGFPIVRDGKPTRPIPLDWPGICDPATAYRGVTYPYWDHAAEELVAVPDVRANWRMTSA